MRIRSSLLLVAAVVLVPAFLAASVAVEKVREAERDVALRGLQETVRATALLVDGEVQHAVGALKALGNSVNLQTGDLRAFYDEAAALNMDIGLPGRSGYQVAADLRGRPGTASLRLIALTGMASNATGSSLRMRASTTTSSSRSSPNAWPKRSTPR